MSPGRRTRFGPSKGETLADESEHVSGVAGRYASALYSLASEQRQTAEVSAMLGTLQKMITESPDLQRLVRSPVFSAADQTKALEDLQAQVNALVDQKQAAEDASFKAIVSMYEQMKPKDAAKIFDTLDIGVLIKIARAMNPRNMSPILAAMSSGPAQQLTTELASVTPQTTVPANSVAAAKLPQIVGH